MKFHFAFIPGETRPRPDAPRKKGEGPRKEEGGGRWGRGQMEARKMLSIRTPFGSRSGGKICCHFPLFFFKLFNKCDVTSKGILQQGTCAGVKGWRQEAPHTVATSPSNANRVIAPNLCRRRRRLLKGKSHSAFQRCYCVGVVATDSRHSFSPGVANIFP